MTLFHRTLFCLFAISLGPLATSRTSAVEQADLEAVLKRPIIGPKLSLAEVQAFVESHVIPLPRPTTMQAWDDYAQKTRQNVLDRVVFRGEAAKWRDAKTKVEWLDTIEGGPGYKIKKLRYEALPGLWIPALLYEPEKIEGKVPVMLAVNGHDREGKAAPYKQIRCINFAKRGMIALNVEWYNMGQLVEGDEHGRLNEIDLCGSSGLGTFYLAMKRGLDILLAHESVDPQRVAVSGLSGGGWQTIFISSLDTRVTLTNPVAGYSSFLTRARHFKDLGDSEQTPTDLAANADYAHLTAMMAPRATLLTFNSKDNCCFESGYALPPLMEAAGPIFELYGHPERLRKHENHDPGDHNFGKDNREALYRMLRDQFYAGADFDAAEAPTEKEVKTKEALAVPLPEGNLTLHSLALSLAKPLPKDGALPTERAAAEKWQAAKRKALREVVKLPDYACVAAPEESPVPAALEKEGVLVASWRFKLGDVWTVPGVELAPKDFIGTTIVVSDAGRAGAAKEIARLLSEKQRVLAIDPFYFGESKISDKDWLFAILVASVGERPLGIQAAQVAAVARWSKSNFGNKPVSILALGPRSSLFSLVAASCEIDAIAGVESRGSLGSLKEVLEQNYNVSKTPELYCLGLLEQVDVLQIAALVAPRPVTFAQPSERTAKELKSLAAWYELLGSKHVPSQL